MDSTQRKAILLGSSTVDDSVLVLTVEIVGRRRECCLLEPYIASGSQDHYRFLKFKHHILYTSVCTGTFSFVQTRTSGRIKMKEILKTPTFRIALILNVAFVSNPIVRSNLNHKIEKSDQTNVGTIEGNFTASSRYEVKTRLPFLLKKRHGGSFLAL